MVLVVTFLVLGFLGIIFSPVVGLVIFMITPFAAVGVIVGRDNYKAWRRRRTQRNEGINNPRSVMYGYVPQRISTTKIVVMVSVAAIVAILVITTLMN